MKTGSLEWINLIQKEIKSFDLFLDKNQENSLAFHARELMKWNKKINLTAIKDPKEIAVKHFLDSLIPGSLIFPEASLLDIGSGGGFPGIPLRILMPCLKITLIDSVRKKISFLQYVIRTINLENARAIHIRAEELAQQPEFINFFDVIICRAFTSLDKFVLMALPLLKKNGVLIALKGKIQQKEVDEVYSLGIKSMNIEIIKYVLPVYNAERSIIKITWCKNKEIV